MFQAQIYLQGFLGRKVENKEIADLVGRALGKETLSPSTVGRWHDGTEPDLATIAAMAKVYRVDPGWLAFGPLSAAPPPGNPIADRLRAPPESGTGGQRKGKGGN